MRKLGLFPVFPICVPADLCSIEFAVPSPQDEPGVIARGVPETGCVLSTSIGTAPEVLGADATEEVDFLNHSFPGHLADPGIRPLKVRHATMKPVSPTVSGRHASIQLNNC